MKFRKIFFSVFILATSYSLAGIAQDREDRVITTGASFLLMTPDARAAGMGELGVATSADAYSQYWNPAKYVFAKSPKGVSLSYTPYLRSIIDGIFLGSLTYYSQINERSSWAGSIKYTTVGEIYLNTKMGSEIVDQGSVRPHELHIDFSYALKLSDRFAMSVAGRYIRSDLKISADVDASSSNSLGVDVAGFYKGNNFDLFNKKAFLRAGFNISNIGPKIKYEEGGQESYIPTNLRFGTGLNFIFDDSNALGINLEFAKLLVPSPVATYDDNNVFITYRQPDTTFLDAIFNSFNDAPGGFSEEMKEFTWALGLEYLLGDNFALRSGYFNESEEKGSRRYLTFGSGFTHNNITIDISYLSSISKIQNPLDNTLRFSFTFNLNPSKSGLNDSQSGQIQGTY
ncbi:type IX secretion system outer membrane channel protein PorV [Flavobacteriaceae bacterium]|nr:type IX secretion system outer membrane channel protein PorV [Flavobacteriaceae bacterium]